MYRVIAAGAMFLASTVACNRIPEADTGSDRFVGEVKTEWASDGRTMVLLEDFAYIDPGGVEWKAPKGSKINGASIPRPFWSIVGPPYVGKYRRASVVHDVACEKQDRPWQQAHLMFYYACLRGGVPEKEAKVFYGVLCDYGKTWEVQEPGQKKVVLMAKPALTDADLRKVEELKRYVEEENPSLEEVEEFMSQGPQASWPGKTKLLPPGVVRPN